MADDSSGHEANPSGSGMDSSIR